MIAMAATHGDAAGLAPGTLVLGAQRGKHISQYTTWLDLDPPTRCCSLRRVDDLEHIVPERRLR